MPKISVIIPFYKTPKLLLIKCIDRLLEQCFDDFELLLINDGNGKDYEDLESRYLGIDNRIKFISQDNGGVSKARNLGIMHASGEYIVFHDADDFVENNYLYCLYKEIKNADLVICGIAAQWYPTVDSIVDIREFLSTPSVYNYIQYTNFTPNKIFKRKVILENNIFFNENMKLGEDALFVAEYLKYCKIIRILPNRLYYYIPHINSATNRYNENYWRDENKVISAQLDLFGTYPLNNIEERFLYHWLYRKIRGVLFYYLWWEKDAIKRDRVLKDILNNKKYMPLIYHNYKDFFDKKDRVIVFLWKFFGIRGVKISYDIKLLYNYINRFLLK